MRAWTRRLSRVAVGCALILVSGWLLARATRAAQTPAAEPSPPTAEDCDPRVRLEAPVDEGPLRGVVPVGGWAVDLSSPAGTGVSDVHVYLDG